MQNQDCGCQLLQSLMRLRPFSKAFLSSGAASRSSFLQPTNLFLESKVLFLKGSLPCGFSSPS